MAEIEWKGALWRAAYGDHDVRELLTILKGYGPMEILEFEKPGDFRGQISISLTKEGTKEITLYHLEIEGMRRKGKGRETLRWLRKIFKGELYVEDPGVILVKNASVETVLFWLKMFREGLIDAVQSEICSLTPHMSEDEIRKVEKELLSHLSISERQCFAASDS